MVLLDTRTVVVIWEYCILINAAVVWQCGLQVVDSEVVSGTYLWTSAVGHIQKFVAILGMDHRDFQLSVW